MKKMSGLCSLFILRVCLTFCVFTNYTVMSSTNATSLQATTSATLTSADRNASTSATSAPLQSTASITLPEAVSERNASTVTTSAKLQPTASSTLPETSAITAPKYVGTNSTDPTLSSITSTSISDLEPDPTLSSTTNTSISDLVLDAERDITKNTSETDSTTKSERISETSTSTAPAVDDYSSRTSSSPRLPPTVTSLTRVLSTSTISSSGSQGTSTISSSGSQEVKKSIAGAEVAAIVLCVLAVIMLGAAIAVWWFRKRKVKRELSRLSDIDMNIFQNDHYNPAPSNGNHLHSQTTTEQNDASNIYTGEPTKQANQLHLDGSPKEEQKSLLSKPSDVITSNYDKSSDDNILDAAATDGATSNQALVVKSEEVLPEPESSLSTFAPEPVKQPSEISEFLYLENDNQNPSQ